MASMFNHAKDFKLFSSRLFFTFFQGEKITTHARPNLRGAKNNTDSFLFPLLGLIGLFRRRDGGRGGRGLQAGQTQGPRQEAL